jgi:hypothetical protein
VLDNEQPTGLEIIAKRLGFSVEETPHRGVMVLFRIRLRGNASQFSFVGNATECQAWLEGWESRSKHDGYS